MVNINEVKLKKLRWKKDWPALPYLFFAVIGFVVSIYDFWQIQRLNFQLNIFIIIGIILLVLGGSLRIISRKTLMKAGFDMINSYKLQIVKGQRLITHGVYRYIRHPLYLAEINRNIGFALIFSSLYGLGIMIFAAIFLLFRIKIEERMLITEFGPDYEEYKKKTNRLIPYFY